MTLGLYQNFPTNVLHHHDVFNSNLSGKQLQQKLLEALCQVNKKEFSFEEVANPTVPDATVIFEFGLAEAVDFTFIDEAELKKMLMTLRKERSDSLDFFCSIRYYKGDEKKSALKFDYYMLRMVFGKDTLEVQTVHERGPRYIAPEDLVMFIFNQVNGSSKRKLLKQSTA